MFPHDSTKTFLSASLAPGPKSEQPISNEQFLTSYLDVACWLRMLSARQCLSVVEDATSPKLEKLAAITAFYQTAGLVVEDALSMYVAWSLWTLDKSKLLPDILERVSLRLREPSSALSPTYAKETQAKYVGSNKRLDVYARTYLMQLMRTHDDDLPRVFGVNWKKHPSVKLVAQHQRPTWDRMGYFFRGCLDPLVNPKGALLASCYNKIKHGPQLVVMSLASAALDRGLEINAEDGPESDTTIRLLLSGARTQETQEEAENNVRSAPFLLLDTENLRNWYFQQIVHISNALYIHGTWIFNTTFITRKRSQAIISDEVKKIILEYGKYLDGTFRPFS
jgi:hypothetical protein